MKRMTKKSLSRTQSKLVRKASKISVTMCDADELKCKTGISYGLAQSIVDNPGGNSPVKGLFFTEPGLPLHLDWRSYVS
jgi:hypothetical protein